MSLRMTAPPKKDGSPARRLSLSLGKSMTILVKVVPVMPTRPCLFCLSLQDDSVFADFEADKEERAFLVRISFDGYGCCHGPFKKMSGDASRRFFELVSDESFEGPELQTLLHSYFQENSDLIWKEALASHRLL